MYHDGFKFLGLCLGACEDLNHLVFHCLHSKELWHSLFQSLVYLGSRNFQYVLEDSVFHMLCGYLFKRKAK